ncbi:phage adaptor protein [Kluyvera sp. CHPC 1.2972]|uniref:phage adaptor protein n=1 Tax=Kluyvera sp. CHPC 1.2972 TaxID=2995176 RepID=UPI002FD7B819
MSTTYNDLVSNIKTWCGRTDSQTINAIPQFIAAAQTALDNGLRIGSMIVTTDYAADALSVDVSDYLEISSVTIAGLVGTSTTYGDITGLRAVINQRPEISGYDFHYAMNGNAIELVKPGAVEVTGYQKPTRITSANQTNAYTDGAENALLWLSLYYCGMFSKDDAAASWQQMAEAEINNLNNSRQQLAKTGTAKRKRHGYF